MANLIVAFPDRQTNHNVCAMLESGGFDVTRTCATGNEVMRAFNLMQDGVLICAARFPDRTADTLAGDLEGRAMMLVVARPAQLELCEHPAIFKLQAPVSRMALNASVSLMLQLFDKRKPRRGRAEEAVVQAAKEQAREYLRRRQPFAWNATSLTPLTRDALVALFEGYGARVRIVYLETGWDENLRRNTSRPARVPEDVIGRMLDRLEPPLPWEAREVEWVSV